jgi:hypothetical protein
MKTIKAEYKVGLNRGNARIWIEGGVLVRAGWNAGDTYITEHIKTGLIKLRKSTNKDEKRLRKVARHGVKPVIEISNTKTAAEIGPKVARVALELTEATITIKAL